MLLAAAMLAAALCASACLAAAAAAPWQPGPASCLIAAAFKTDDSTSRRLEAEDGTAGHRRDCHSAHALSPSLLIHLLQVEGGAAE